MKKIHIVFILFVCLFYGRTIMYAQTERPDYCICKAATKISDLSELYIDSLYTTYSEDSFGVRVSIYNTTKDTLYVFNSYIQNHIVSSKYLHRINTKDKLYKVSFLPLVPYIATKYSDIVSDNLVLGHQQTVYDFFKLLPNSKQDVFLPYHELFKNKDCQNNALRDFDVKLLHKYTKKLPQKFYTTTKLKDRYMLLFEFAVYKDVSLLCNQSAYYLQEYNFDQQAKSFSILSVPIAVKNYNHPALR